MAHCKHWHDGVCKDCRKNCPIKKKLAAKAAKKAARLAEARTLESGQPLDVAPDVSARILHLTGGEQLLSAKKKKGKKAMSVPTAPAPAATTPPTTAAESLPADDPRAEALLHALVHGKRVAAFARELFRATRPLHELDDLWGGVLDWAALLHDVGWMDGQRRHHKRSARLIRRNEIPGQDVPETVRPYAALVARYHRRRPPSRRQKRFAALDGTEQRAVRQLAALLRLADALDYSHTGAVKSLEAHLADDALVLKLTSPLGCTAEQQRLDSKAELFRQVFDKDVRGQLKGRKR